METSRLDKLALGSDASVTRSTQVSPGSSRVIHPSHLKYDESRRMPYLALIDRLRTFLRKPSAVLVVCGYSFRDDHINEVITQALQSNPGLMIFALMYGELARYAKAQRIAETRGNISLLALDQAVIGRRAGPWRPAEPAEIVDGYAPAIDIGNANGATSLRFALGDFQKFGLFLDTIVGVNTSQATV